MPSIDFKEHILPHLVAVIIFAFVVILFFKPVMFENKSLSQHDILQWKGGAKELIDFREQTGEEGLWTNSMFGGMPGYLVNVVYSGDLMRYVQKVLTLGLPGPMNLIFLAFISFYFMMLAFKVRPWLAISAALAFGFTSFLIISIGAGHNSKVAAVAIMPLVLAGIHLTFDRNKIIGFVLTALSLALELRVNHLQITYYLLLIVIFYGVAQLVNAIKEKTLPEFLKTVGILIIAAGLSVGTNIGRLWGIMEYGEYTIRGKSELASRVDKPTGLDKDYAFQYSNGILEPLVLFIPNFMGGTPNQDLGKNSELAKTMRRKGIDPRQASSAPAYWGDQPLTAPYYAGAIVVFLFVLSMFFLEGKQKYWMLSIIVFSIVLSWGKNFSTFNYFVFDYLPGYNKFRSVTFTIIIAVFTMVLSGFMGLERFISDGWNKKSSKKFLYAVGITGGFALLTVLFAGLGSFSGAVDSQLVTFPKWYLPALKADRESLMRSDALRSLFFVISFAAVIWLYMKEKVGSTIAFLLFGLLIFFDMFMIDKRFVSKDSFKRNPSKAYFTPTAADQVIIQDNDPNFRVFNLQNAFNDARTSYHHKSIGGYHGAKMRRYQDLIENGIANESSELIDDLRNGIRDFSSKGILNMLNTKYLIAGNQARAVIRNPNANGNAWFINEVRIVNTPDEEIAMVNDIDTKSVAVMDGSRFKSKNTKYSAANIISLLEYQPNYLKYEANCFDDGFAVFSEIYYPKGWVAKMDGQPIDILRVNYVLRALDISKGSHVIEFKYEPDSYYVGNKLMWVFNILVIVLFVGGVVYTTLYRRS